MKRTIDADELKKAIETYDKFACLPDTRLIPFRMLNEPEKDYEPYVHLRDIRNAIDNASTVEERPHGKWIYRGRAVSGLYHNLCPICKQDVISDRTNYCGNCGADMREK